MRALFDDVRKIAPKAAYDIIGSVSGWPPKQRHQSLISVLGQDSTLRFGNYRRTTSLRPPPGTKRKGPRWAHSTVRRIPNTTWRTVRPIGPSVRARRPTVRDATDTHSSCRRSRRNLRCRRHRDGTRLRGWRRRRHIGFPMVPRLRRWRPLSSRIASSRAACYRPWTRTTVHRSSKRFTSWALLVLAR